MSINVAKWTFLMSLCASRITSFWLLPLSDCPSWGRVELLPFLVHCCFLIRMFHRLWHRNKLVHQVVTCHRNLHDLLVDMIRFLVDSWASTMHACFVFGILLGSRDSSSQFLERLERFFVLFLQGICASIGASNFLLAFFDGFLKNHHLPDR